MIKANEIRLGNYLLTPKEQIFTVKAIDFDRLHDENGEYIVNHFSLHKCKPIELNEDILVKCGFECFEFDNGQPNQYRFKSRLIVIRDNVFVDYGSDVKIYHLHTLQNLIFALTGEELNSTTTTTC